MGIRYCARCNHLFIAGLFPQADFRLFDLAKGEAGGGGMFLVQYCVAL